MQEPFKPDFIGVGTPRSGTSWLANCLRGHQEICISEPKEVRYFNRYAYDRAVWRSGRPVGIIKTINNNYDRPLSWYANHFRHCGTRRIKGEWTPVYFFDETAPGRIRELFPDVKLLVSLRNPIDRVVSHCRLLKGRGLFRNEPFEEIISGNPMLVEMGLYAEQMNRYLERFDRNRILVLVFDDFVRNPVAELKRTFEFLGVSTSFDTGIVNSDTNPSEIQRLVRLRRYLYRGSRALIGLGLGRFVHRLRRMGAHQWVVRANRQPQQVEKITPETRAWLLDRFSQDIDELQTLIGRDLSGWKKDQPV